MTDYSKMGIKELCILRNQTRGDVIQSMLGNKPEDLDSLKKKQEEIRVELNKRKAV